MEVLAKIVRNLDRPKKDKEKKKLSIDFPKI
jgi:hypothetical protein